MRFVKFKGENGQDVFVNPLWVSSVVVGVGRGEVSDVTMVGGACETVRGIPSDVVAVLTGEPQTVRYLRSLGEQ